MADTQYVDLTLDTGLRVAVGSPEDISLMRHMAYRIYNAKPEQLIFQEWCKRADDLYYANSFQGRWGADLWPTDPSAQVPGRSHVSVNTPAVYVDIPAALQSVPPITNMLATDTTDKAREAAAHLRRLYILWQFHEDWDLKFHKTNTVKELYGRAASRTYWDEDAVGGPHPCVEIIEQPRNLYMGYRTDSYTDLEWCAYVTRMDPNEVAEQFGVDVVARDALASSDDPNAIVDQGTVMPYVQQESLESLPTRAWLRFGSARIEVWDYWYREPVWNRKHDKVLRMVTMNVIIAGNMIVRGPIPYPEYEGDMPYKPLYNTFVPGVPNGRPALYDMEPLIREKFERITSGSQMIASGTAGDFWQLTGPDAPSRVPPSLKPTRNRLVAPGAGNRIETITPFIAQFQLEQFLGRIDREMAIVSGLNDLLLGLAPAQVLSSSKAIDALVSNYETRISMRRDLLYTWTRDVWELTLKVWANKDKTGAVAKIVQQGGGHLELIDPSLSPRDEPETAVRATNLVGAKLWSLRRGMAAVGVDDPETEQDIIREERTDATLFPQDVQVMAQLMAALQSLNLNAPGGAAQQAQGQLASGQSDLAKALGAGTAQNTSSSQTPGTQGQLPPGGETPGAPPAGDQPFAQAGANPGTPGGPNAPIPGRPGGPPVLQNAIVGGALPTSRNRIQSQTALPQRGPVLPPRK